MSYRFSIICFFIIILFSSFCMYIFMHTCIDRNVYILQPCWSCNIMLKYMLYIPLIKCYIFPFNFYCKNLVWMNNFKMDLLSLWFTLCCKNIIMQSKCMCHVIICSQLMMANLLLASAIQQLGTQIPSTASSAGINARTPPKKPSIGQKKPLEAHGSSPPLPRCITFSVLLQLEDDYQWFQCDFVHFTTTFFM